VPCDRGGTIGRNQRSRNPDIFALIIGYGSAHHCWTMCALMPLSGLPDLWGTADMLCFDQQGRVAAVVDLKTGFYPVEATALQPAIYALLAARMFGAAPHGVAIWIIQPRGDHPKGPARGVQYSVTDLTSIETFIRSAAARTYHPQAARIPGTWCRFCRIELTCPERLSAQQI
jgi:hypothetical protein